MYLIYITYCAGRIKYRNLIICDERTKMTSNKSDLSYTKSLRCVVLMQVVPPGCSYTISGMDESQAQDGQASESLCQ